MNIMHSRAWSALQWRSLLLGLWVGLALCLAAPVAHAQADPPGRVGRLADFNGSVSWWDHETGAWAEAQRNRPLTGGDRVSTALSGRAELRVGSTVLRLSNNTELEVLRLDDERMVFQLHSGSLALRLRSREVAAETEVVTAESRLLPLRAGHYRIDRVDDTTLAGSWRGELQVDEASGPVVGAGRRVEIYRESRRGGGPGALRTTAVDMPGDGFNEWVLAEDRRDERSASNRYVSPEMTGAEDLDRYGRWEQHPDYGALWLPLSVRADWAPYRYGRWGWVQPWGWTWIDEAPWGFAPFHYGRWVSWRGRWGWVPGAYVPRPVYAPALVAWVGGSQWGVSVQIGGPTVGWVPLAPREVYRPHYRSTPVYVERVNPAPPYRWQHPPGQVPTGPISYGNQGVPNAVTVVPKDVLVRRQPVGAGVVELPAAAPRAPLTVQAPPPSPAGPYMPGWRRPERGDGEERGRPVQAVPGGAQPLPAAPVHAQQAVPVQPPVVLQPPQPQAQPQGPVPVQTQTRPQPDPRGDNRSEERRRDRAQMDEGGERLRGREPRREAPPEFSADAPRGERTPAQPPRAEPRPEPRPAAAAPAPVVPQAPVRPPVAAAPVVVPVAPAAPAERAQRPEREKPRDRDRDSQR